MDGPVGAPTSPVNTQVSPVASLVGPLASPGSQLGSTGGSALELEVAALQQTLVKQQGQLQNLSKELASSVSDLHVKLAHELSEVLNVVEQQREGLTTTLEARVGDLKQRTDRKDADLRQCLDVDRQAWHDAVAELRAEMGTSLAQARCNSAADGRTTSTLAELTRAIKAEREGRDNDVARLRASFNEMMATAASGVRVELSALQKQLSSLEEREMKLHREIAAASGGVKADDLQRLATSFEKEQIERLAVQTTMQSRLEDLAKQCKRLEKDASDRMSRSMQDPQVILSRPRSPVSRRSPPGSPGPGRPGSPRGSGGRELLGGIVDGQRTAVTIAAAAAVLGSNGGGKDAAIQELTTRLENRSSELSAVRLRTARISGLPWAAARVELARGLEAETEARQEDTAKLASCIQAMNRSHDLTQAELTALARRVQHPGLRQSTSGIVV